MIFSGHNPVRFAWKTCVIATVLTMLYVALVCMQAGRRLWYDELLTYYIAKAPSLTRFFDLLKKWDLSPPAANLLSRASMSVFGGSELAVRLPSIVEFYIGSALLFFYTRRKTDAVFAAIPLLILWDSLFFRYATEARAYALVFMFFSMLLLCWDIAATNEHRRVAVWGVAISTAGLIASHVFAVLSIAPFLAAEAVRFVKRRKAGYALWAALLLPCIGVVGYRPLIARYETITYFPPAFQASLMKALGFYGHNLSAVLWALFLLLAAAVVVTNVQPQPQTFRLADLVVFAMLLVNPIALNLVLMRGHGAFWDRYCITTAVAAFVLFALWLAQRFTTRAARVGVITVTCLILIQQVALPLRAEFRYGPPAKTAVILQNVKPNLPLVAASGLTFVEMSHYENSALASRLYYLTDHCAAIRYAHATIFEQMGEMVKDFGLSGTVEPYMEFIRRHRHFLAVGTFGYPEDWLLDKLVADGATVTPVGYYAIPYKDRSVYEVTLADFYGHQ